MNTTTIKDYEVMAPVGSRESLQAAIQVLTASTSVWSSSTCVRIQPIISPSTTFVR